MPRFFRTRLEAFIGHRIDLAGVLSAARAAATVLLKDVSLPAEYSSSLQEALVAKVKSETDLERAHNEARAEPCAGEDPDARGAASGRHQRIGRPSGRVRK